MIMVTEGDDYVLKLAVGGETAAHQRENVDNVGRTRCRYGKPQVSPILN